MCKARRPRTEGGLTLLLFLCILLRILLRILPWQDALRILSLPPPRVLSKFGLPRRRALRWSFTRRGTVEQERSCCCCSAYSQSAPFPATTPTIPRSKAECVLESKAPCRAQAEVQRSASAAWALAGSFSRTRHRASCMDIAAARRAALVAKRRSGAA